MLKLYMCEIPKHCTLEELERLSGAVPEERKIRIFRFRKMADSLRTLTGDLLVQYALQQDGSLDEELVPSYIYNAYGKPFLKEHPDFHFNVSHSGKWAVCAVHDEPVGADIEQRLSDDFRLEKGIFTDYEREQLHCFPNPAAPFYNLWTMKESFVKALGCGLSMPMQSFEVDVQSGKIDILSSDVERGDYACLLPEAPEGYSLSVCARRESIEASSWEMIKLNFNQLSVPLISLM